MTYEFSDNLSKYSNPKQYDETYKDYTADLTFISEHLKVSQTIIELACGTGRLAIPLAQQGHIVYGVDIDAGMLQFAKQKAHAEGLQIHFSMQDCTQLSLPIQTNFIYMTGNSFQHFLTNVSQDALFESVKKHLNAGGEFIFDTRNPILQELATSDIFEESLEQNGEMIKVIHEEQYDAVTQILLCTSTYKSTENTYQDSIKLRYTYPLELKRLLQQHNFEIVHLYGSWNKAAFTAQSPSMVVHARLI